MKKVLYMLIAIGMISSSCKESKDEDPITPSTPNRKAYVVNEGSFGASNGSISRIDLVTGDVVQEIFQTTNNRPLGDVVQSMAINNGKGYIVANNSAKIEEVLLSDFTSTGTFSGLSSPRFMSIINSTKAVFSEWVINAVKIVDLTSNTITKQIATAEGPEQIAISDNKIFVCNSGGFSADSTITVIDIATEQVVATIQVGHRPASIVMDKNSKLWVLCRGALGPDWTPGTADDIAGSLLRIDPVSNSIEMTYSMASSEHPVSLQINGIGDQLYFLYGNSDYTGEPRTMNINDMTLPTGSLLGRQCYGLGVDPVSGNIYCGIAPSFSVNGTVIRLNSTGALIDSIEVGIAPNGFVFEE